MTFGSNEMKATLDTIEAWIDGPSCIGIRSMSFTFLTEKNARVTIQFTREPRSTSAPPVKP